jgi:hypothetical protein
LERIMALESETVETLEAAALQFGRFLESDEFLALLRAECGEA